MVVVVKRMALELGVVREAAVLSARNSTPVSNIWRELVVTRVSRVKGVARQLVKGIIPAYVARAG